MAGIGSKLLSSWAFPLESRGAHLPRKALEYGDSDDTERTIWQDWFFEAEAPPPAGQPFIKRFGGTQHAAHAPRGNHQIRVF